MPLNEYGEKLDSNGYAPSILHDKPVCLICGRYGTARHEVYFGSAYRAKSKRLGLWVTLCPWCHQNGPTAIHNNRDADLRLKCWAQKKAMEQKTLRPLEFGKIDNEELLKKLESAAKQGWRWAVIEMVASYGMSVGRDVFDTTVWIGRFYQVLSSRCSVRMMCRIEEKKHICHDSRANDTAIRRALIDRFAAHDLKNGKGTKKAPDFFYGFKADVWAAYALGLTAIENRENDYKFSTT